MAPHQGSHRPQANPDPRPRRSRQRTGAAAVTAPDTSAHPAERAVHRSHRHGGFDDTIRHGDRDRAADRRGGSDRCRDRVRRADLGQRHHQRHVLPARRRLQDRRIHPERQLQGDRGILQPALNQAPPSSRPLYTVPFGSLGAVQNMSRDWVIDKLTVSVTYDTDLAAVKKIIKRVGAELAADAEFAPQIIETLKMQGVEEFGEFAVQIRMKMMTKPGEQFVIRRRAYALIKSAFENNGIKFAFPTVHVAGGPTNDSPAVQAAVGHKGLELVKPPPAPPPA